MCDRPSRCSDLQFVPQADPCINTTGRACGWCVQTVFELVQLNGMQCLARRHLSFTSQAVGLYSPSMLTVPRDLPRRFSPAHCNPAAAHVSGSQANDTPLSTRLCQLLTYRCYSHSPQTPSSLMRLCAHSHTSSAAPPARTESLTSAGVGYIE